ncbi:MAG: DUF885 domain-containing protein [SAR86 cluster bacterium]|uniref:DUF885 domain-containing protein n=1 Tax=SAR86 cluster bacterium TaxID=2030880 RepID=A0A2A4MPC6_9GAMM|nr:MAG: DUF885 domain-containing protein [SAR86 cluster bacterium]
MRKILLLAAVILSSCNNESPSEPIDIASSPAPTISESLRLNTWFDARFEEELDFSPEFKTYLGDKTDYGQLDDYSEAGFQRELEWRRDTVVQLQAKFDYDKLNDDAKLSWDMWVYSLAQSERQLPYLQHRYIFGRGGPQVSLPNFLINYHKVDTASDMQAYLSRLEQIDRVFSQRLLRAKAASAAGIRQPRFAYESALSEIARVTEGAPFSSSDNSPNSPLWTDILSKLDGLIQSDIIDADQALSFRQQAQLILSGEVLTAYTELGQWLEQDKLLASPEAQGAWALPNGEAYYNYRLALMTTVDITADEIHAIGLSEVARIRTEMEAIMNQVEFEGSLQDFFGFMRDDEQFYYPSTDAGRQAYLDLNKQFLAAVAQKLPDYFGRLPKAELEVRRVEAFREQAGAAQHYAAGTPDGSRAGVFYSHMIDMSALPIFQLEDVAYHEGNPGHHMQISIQQELTEVPRFRTQYRTTAYTEGWGLYAEWLAKEMGFYKDPYSDFGRLSGEIWRAIRLVVDTGIHAMQWSEDEAVAYFMDNSPQPEAAVRSEIQRYITGPGQATAYKIGMLKIQEVRAKAESALGSEFDIKGFHDVILGAGALPLTLMEQRVDRWIESF